MPRTKKPLTKSQLGKKLDEAKKEQAVKPEDFGKDVPNKLEGGTPSEN